MGSAALRAGRRQGPPSAPGSEERSLAALKREGEIGGRFAHPSLVRLLRWSGAPPRPDLVLELVNTRSVEDHLEDIGPVRVPETCLLGVRVLAALQYMHAQGVHLDVKPANVTMGDPPRLLDLSVARGPVQSIGAWGGRPTWRPSSAGARC